MARVAAGALAIVLLAAVASTLLAYGPNPTPDAAVLLALRRGLQDPHGALQSWDQDLVDPCSWFHITCDREDIGGRVIRM